MKFDFKTLENDVMTYTGNKILNRVTNRFPHFLDLFIREALQNSLDASLETKDKKYTKVDISTIKFGSNDLLKHLDNYTSLDKDRHFTDALVVKDQNTTGLTGDVSNDKSKLYKLVFDFDNAQTTQGAGGSHGVGKLIYYTAAVGLVIYYTRVKKTNGYGSKLIISYIEDNEKHSSRIEFNKLNLSGKYAGINWWGKLVNGKMNPITNEDDIEQFLSIFEGLETYQNDETGTTIIMPYYNKQNLPECSNDSPNFIKSFDEYVKTVIQRWYCFRLNNAYYSYGKFLYATVNGERIKNEYSFFKRLQELYNNNFLDSNQQKKGYKSLDFNKIRGVSQSAGKFSYTMIGRDDLKYDSAENEPSPNYLIYNEDSKENIPIVAYSRKPGMIINYNKGIISKSVEMAIPKGQYFIGVFSLNGEAEVYVPPRKNNLKFKSIVTIEDYFRKAENSTHEQWQDMKLLTKNGKEHDGSFARFISNKVSGTIADFIKGEEEKSSEQFRKTNRYARKLGALLLPQLDEKTNMDSSTYGGPSGAGGSGGYERKKHKRTGTFSKPRGNKEKTTLEIKYDKVKYLKDNKQKIYLNMHIPNIQSKSIFTINLCSDKNTPTKNNVSSYEGWIKNINPNYPIQIEQIMFYEKEDKNFIILEKNQYLQNEEEKHHVFYNDFKIKIRTDFDVPKDYILMIQYKVENNYTSEIVFDSKVGSYE